MITRGDKKLGGYLSPVGLRQADKPKLTELLNGVTSLLSHIIRSYLTRKKLNMKQYLKKLLPKEGKYAVIRILHNSIKQIGEYENLEDAEDEYRKSMCDESRYIIDDQGAFLNKIKLPQAIDLREVCNYG